MSHDLLIKHRLIYLIDIDLSIYVALIDAAVVDIDTTSISASSTTILIRKAAATQKKDSNNYE